MSEKEYDFNQAQQGAVVKSPPGKTRITIRIDTDMWMDHPVWWQKEGVEAETVQVQGVEGTLYSRPGTVPPGPEPAHPTPAPLAGAPRGERDEPPLAVTPQVATIEGVPPNYVLILPLGDTVIWIETEGMVRGRQQVNPFHNREAILKLAGALRPLAVKSSADCALVERITPNSPEGQAIAKNLMATQPRLLRAEEPPQFAKIRSIDRVGDWVLFQASFEQRFEPAIFALQITTTRYRYAGVLWGGQADTAEEIRNYLASRLPEAPPELIAYLEPAKWFVAGAATDELGKARQALIAFFDLLHDRRYEEAIRYYGGSYDDQHPASGRGHPG